MHKIFKTSPQKKITLLLLAILIPSFTLPANASTTSNRATFKKVEPLLLTKTDVSVLQGPSLTVNSSQTGYLTTVEHLTKTKSDAAKIESKLKKKFLDITTKAASATAQCNKKVSVTILGEANGDSFEVLKDSGTTQQNITSSVSVLKGDAKQLVKNRVAQNCILPIAEKLSNDIMALLPTKITFKIDLVKSLPSSSLPKSCTGYSVKSSLSGTEATADYKSTAITIICGQANLATTYGFEVGSTSGSYVEITPEEEILFIDIVKRTLSK